MFRIPRSLPKLPFPERRKSLNMNKETVSKEKYNNKKKILPFLFYYFVGRTPVSWRFGRAGVSF